MPGFTLFVAGTGWPPPPQVKSAWSVKTRRTPSQRFRDARVYSHTTTAVHDNNGYTPAVALLVDIVGNESYSLTAADPGVGGVF